MGLFDIFKSSPSKDAILGQVRKAKEVYAQPEYRRMAMEKLLKWGDDESLRGVLERFCVVVQSPHWDEDEKRWLVSEMVKIGDKSKPILKEFIFNKNEVNHALIAYRQILNNDEEYKNLLMQALKLRIPSDHRTVQSKQELIAALNEFNDSECETLLVPYLFDHSDDVQCAAIDALAKSSDPKVQAKLTELLASEQHSARVLRSVASVIATQKIPVHNEAKLSDALSEEYRIASGFLVPVHHG